MPRQRLPVLGRVGAALYTRFAMEVTFERTGERRYAVRLVVPGHGTRYTNPAPGYDAHIPHDLVHYMVEAELSLASGVFGRAAQGGSGFLVTDAAMSARQRTRAQRKQKKRETSLEQRDAHGDMVRAERLALLCDVAYRRRQGATGAAQPWLAPAPPSVEEAQLVERVVARLAQVAPRWHALPVGGSLSFVWPSAEPR